MYFCNERQGMSSLSSFIAQKRASCSFGLASSFVSHRSKIIIWVWNFMRVSKRNLHFPRRNILMSHGHITPFVFVFLLKAYFFVLFIKASLRGVTPIPLSLFSLLFMLLCVKRLWKQGHRSIIYVAVEIFNTSEAAVCTNILKSNCVFTSEEQKH